VQKATGFPSEFTTAEHNNPLLERFPEATNHQCSCLALTAHSSPQNLLTLQLIYQLRPRLRAQRGRSLQPKHASSHRDVPAEQWMSIPVPALVDAALFDAVQEQLQANRQRARVPQRGAKYLLQSLIVCACCGYAYYGKQISPSGRKHHPRSYAYYRCVGADAYRFGGVRQGTEQATSHGFGG